MNCPNGHADDSTVIASRKLGSAQYTKRRRCCLKCDARWNTVEIPVTDLEVWQEQMQVIRQTVMAAVDLALADKMKALLNQRKELGCYESGVEMVGTGRPFTATSTSRARKRTPVDA